MSRKPKQSCENCGVSILYLNGHARYCKACVIVMQRYRKAMKFIIEDFGKLSGGHQDELVTACLHADGSILSLFTPRPHVPKN